MLMEHNMITGVGAEAPKVFVVVTHQKTAEIIEAESFLESGATLVFQIREREQREFSKRDLLLWEECGGHQVAERLVAELGLSIA